MLSHSTRRTHVRLSQLNLYFVRRYSNFLSAFILWHTICRCNRGGEDCTCWSGGTNDEIQFDCLYEALEPAITAACLFALMDTVSERIWSLAVDFQQELYFWRSHHVLVVSMRSICGLFVYCGICSLVSVSSLLWEDERRSVIVDRLTNFGKKKDSDGSKVDRYKLSISAMIIRFVIFSVDERVSDVTELDWHIV